MRRVAYFVPTGWAMEGVNAMLAFGAGAREVAPFGLAFAAMFVTFLILAARRLQPWSRSRRYPHRRPDAAVPPDCSVVHLRLTSSAGVFREAQCSSRG